MDSQQVHTEGARTNQMLRFMDKVPAFSDALEGEIWTDFACFWSPSINFMRHKPDSLQSPSLKQVLTGRWQRARLRPSSTNKLIHLLLRVICINLNVESKQQSVSLLAHYWAPGLDPVTCDVEEKCSITCVCVCVCAMLIIPRRVEAIRNLSLLISFTESSHSHTNTACCKPVWQLQYGETRTGSHLTDWTNKWLSEAACEWVTQNDKYTHAHLL